MDVHARSGWTSHAMRDARANVEKHLRGGGGVEDGTRGADGVRARRKKRWRIDPVRDVTIGPSCTMRRLFAKNSGPHPTQTIQGKAKQIYLVSFAS